MSKFDNINKPFWADVSLFVMAFIWGSGFVVTKTGLDALSPVALIAVRFTIASIALGILNYKKLKNITKEDIKVSILIGTVLFIGFLFQTQGLVTTSAGKSAFLTSIYVAFVPLITIIMTKKKPDIFNLVAVILMLMGIYLLTYNAQNTQLIENGDVLTIIGSLFFGAHVFLLGELSSKRDPFLIATLQIWVACILAYGYLIITDSFVITINSSNIGGLLYLGVVGSAITFLIQNVAQKYTSATHAGIIMSMESVFGTILGIIFLGEIFTFRMGLGAIVIFLALVVAETKLSFLKKKDVALIEEDLLQSQIAE